MGAKQDMAASSAASKRDDEAIAAGDGAAPPVGVPGGPLKSEGYLLAGTAGCDHRPAMEYLESGKLPRGDLGRRILAAATQLAREGKIRPPSSMVIHQEGSNMPPMPPGTNTMIVVHPPRPQTAECCGRRRFLGTKLVGTRVLCNACGAPAEEG